MILKLDRKPKYLKLDALYNKLESGIHAPLVAKFFFVHCSWYGVVRGFDNFTVLVPWGPEIWKPRTATYQNQLKNLTQLEPRGARIHDWNHFF